MSEGEMSKFRSTAVNIDKCTQDASTASLSYGWRVMMGITKWADGYFGNGVADSRSSFGVCLPKGIGEGNNDIFKDIGDSFGEWVKRFRLTEDQIKNKFTTDSRVTACQAK